MASGISLKSENRRRHVILFVMGGVMLATSAAVSNVRALFAPGDLAAAIQEQQGGTAFAAFAGDPFGAGNRRLAPAARFIRNGNRVPGSVPAGPGSDQVPGLIGDQGGSVLPSAANPAGGLPAAIGPDGVLDPPATGPGPGPNGGSVPPDGPETAPPFTQGPSTPTPTEPLPEPETWAMMLLGIGFSGWMARRARHGAAVA